MTAPISLILQKRAVIDRAYSGTCQFISQSTASSIPAPSMCSFQAGRQVLEHFGDRGILNSSTAEYVAASAGADEEACVIQRKRSRACAERTPLPALPQELLDVREVKCGNHRINTFEISSDATDRLVAAKIADYRND